MPDQIHKKKSIHTGIGTAEQYVRIRHPEYKPPGSGDGNPEPIALPDMLAQTPEENILSLDRPCYPASDPRCYPLDHFSRELAGSSYSPSIDGDAWGGYATAILKIVAGYEIEATTATYAGISAPWWGEVRECQGATYYTHTSRPAWSICEGLDNTFVGYEHYESWLQYTVPATPPTDPAGVIFADCKYVNDYPSNPGGAGVYMRVFDAEPSAENMGTTVALLPPNVLTDVFVPYTLLPAAGETLYVGFSPAWVSDRTGQFCGFNWPRGGKTMNSDVGGVWKPSSATWQSWDSSSDDWGSGEDGDTWGAWWSGNLPWDVNATGGTYGITNDSLYLTVASGGQESLIARMDGANLVTPDDDDTTDYGEPWTHPLGVRMAARFKLTTAGDTSDTGPRFARFVWHDERDPITATVHLGDSNHAQGIEIEVDGTSSFVEKDITEDAWMWISVDTRNPNYVRAKMWEEGPVYGSKEPPVYDVSVGRDDDSAAPTDDNYFEFSVTLGNPTGADQTFQLDAIFFCGPGMDCHWVTEKIGQGDGDVVRFFTSQPWKEGALWFFIDGMHTRTLDINRETGEFRLIQSIAPAEYANLIARYMVDRNPDGD